MEKEITSTFQEYDQTERELFTAFTNAIRDSHEKQRAQLEYTKYFGLILSITGSFLAFCYSTMKKQDLKRFIEEKLTTLDGQVENGIVRKLMQSNESTLNEVSFTRKALEEIRNLVSSSAPKPTAVPQSQATFNGEIRRETVINIVGAVFICYVILRILS